MLSEPFVRLVSDTGDAFVALFVVGAWQQSVSQIRAGFVTRPACEQSVSQIRAGFVTRPARIMLSTCAVWALYESSCFV